MDGADLDLAALRALEALLLERHVTRAAQRIQLSQPAMSRALARLRAHFGDDLLVRGAAGYELTPRGENLLPAVRRILQDIASLSHPASFAPARYDAQITLAGLDLELQLFVPWLLERLQRTAPRVRLRALAFSHGDFRVLDDNEVDVVVTAFPNKSQSHRRRLLYGNDFACVMGSRLATRLNGALSLEQFVALPHGLVSFEGRGEGQVDPALRELGLKRDIAVRLPGFLLVPTACAARDLVFTLPTWTGLGFPRSPSLTWLPVPLALAPTRTFLYWHPRRHLDPAHRWFRELVFERAAEIAVLAGNTPVAAQ
ncbi:MAG: LysR family transcriptional regulator [Gammaproteobacteria bacterium]